mgnify:CR=1 FL=1
MQQQRKDEARSSASDQAAAAGAYNGGKSIPKQNKKSKPVKRSQADKDAGVAKMDAEDKEARKAQADKFAAIKKSADKKLKASVGNIVPTDIQPSSATTAKKIAPIGPSSSGGGGGK